MVRGARIQELREAVQFIKDYSAGREAQSKGQTWRCEWLRNSPWAGKPLPIYMGVVGPRAMALAGELADAVWIRGLDAEMVSWYLEVIGRGAKKSGRDPASIKIWIRTQIFIAPSKQQALPEVAAYAATQAANLWSAVFARETPDTIDLRQRIERKLPGLIDEMRQIHDSTDLYGPNDVPPVSQGLVDFLQLTGCAEEIGGTIEKMRDSGVTGISTVMQGSKNQPDMMRRIAEEIMPRFQ